MKEIHLDCWARRTGEISVYTRMCGKCHKTIGKKSSASVFCEDAWERVNSNSETKGRAGCQVAIGEGYRVRPKM